MLGAGERDRSQISPKERTISVQKFTIGCFRVNAVEVDIICVNLRPAAVRL